MYNTIANQHYQSFAYTNRNPSGYPSVANGGPQFRHTAYNQGYNNGYNQGYVGYDHAFQNGYQNGYNNGYDQGYRQPTYVANNNGWGGLGAGIQVGPFSAGVGFGNLLNGLVGGIGGKYW